MSVEQNRLKRQGVGLRALDRERVCPGYTLFAPSSGDGTEYLIDLEGNVVHTWKLPYPPGLYGRLNAEGLLHYNGRTPGEFERMPNWQRFKGGVVLEADWNGRVLWELRHPDHHHDSCRLSNGNTMILEGSFGRLFEVMPEGTLVWEYVNPYFASPAAPAGVPEANDVFRAYRYSEEEIARARATGVMR